VAGERSKPSKWRCVVGLTAEEIGLCVERGEPDAGRTAALRGANADERIHVLRPRLSGMPQDAASARLPHPDHPDPVRDGDLRRAAHQRLPVFEHDGVRRPVFSRRLRIFSATASLPSCAELGARHSFQEAGQLLSKLLPRLPTNHTTIRNRTHRAATEIEASSDADPGNPSPSSKEIVVISDGAHIRAVPGHQSRHLDVKVGKVEVAGLKPRRFAFAPEGADRPFDMLRVTLGAQGWRPGQKETVISDGEAFLPNMVRAATREPVRHILDWFHFSMHMRPIEQMLLGLSGRNIQVRPLQAAQASIGRLKHLRWHGRPAQTDHELVRFAHHSDDITRRDTDPDQVVARDLLRHCCELRSCVQNNRRAIVSYHRRYHSDRPISTSRAEGCVDGIANARMGRRQRMRWSPRGAHRVAVVRAAVLEGGLGANSRDQMVAQSTRFCLP
jgi:hypothetical protein